ncbi:MAG: bifunctional 2-C-methyl-D-erythritol 4-phosphate cytidylyltransferase/2-C-methyl-D-erythritol 2,4-cyclodiphosphate synthase [Pikeienuella sp.]
MTELNIQTTVLIVAAGRGVRAGAGLPKQYRSVAGQPILTRTILAVLASEQVSSVRVCINPDHLALYNEATASITDTRLGDPIEGAAERALTVRNGLEALTDTPPGNVLIHDGARPFITKGTIDDLIEALQTTPCALVGLPAVDALRTWNDNGQIGLTVPRDGVWRAQTPQGFHFADILSAHRSNDDPMAPDDAEVARKAGLRATMVLGASENFKITSAADFDRAEKQCLNMAEPMLTDIRLGQGYDVHALVEGSGVILCGVEIPFHQKLSGHSDADVAMHALTDAIFGALAEGDIGQWFPPSDMQWKGAASSIFLEKAMERIRARGGRLNNADITIICEQPKIGPYAIKMRESLAAIMGIDVARISVKATTSEKLGFTGRGEGIAAMATAAVALP